jgi:hypothetical protein
MESVRIGLVPAKRSSAKPKRESPKRGSAKQPNSAPSKPRKRSSLSKQPNSAPPKLRGKRDSPLALAQNSKNEKFLEVKDYGVPLSAFAKKCKAEFKLKREVGMLKACRKGAVPTQKNCRYPTWLKKNVLLTHGQWATMFEVANRLSDVLSRSMHNGVRIWFEQAVVIDLTATAIINRLLRMGLLCKPDGESSSLPAIYSWNIITLVLRYMQKKYGSKNADDMAPFKLTRFPQRGANSIGSKSHFVPDDVLRHFQGHRKIIGRLNHNRHNQYGAHMLFSAVRHHLGSNSTRTLGQAAAHAFPHSIESQNLLLKFWKAFMRLMWVESCTTFSRIDERGIVKTHYGIFSNYIIANVASELFGRPLFFEVSTIMVKNNDGQVECDGDGPHLRRFQPFFQKLGNIQHIVVKCGNHAPPQQSYEAIRRKSKGTNRNMPKHSKLKWIDFDTVSETKDAAGKIVSEYVIRSESGVLTEITTRVLKRMGFSSKNIQNIFNQANKYLGHEVQAKNSLQGIFKMGRNRWNWDTVLNADGLPEFLADFDPTVLKLPDDLVNRFQTFGGAPQAATNGHSNKRKNASRKVIKELRPRKPRKRKSPARAEAQARAQEREQQRRSSKAPPLPKTAPKSNAKPKEAPPLPSSNEFEAQLAELLGDEVDDVFVSDLFT